VQFKLNSIFEGLNTLFHSKIWQRFSGLESRYFTMLGH